MSAPWYLEKGQREIVAGRRFEGGAPLNIAGIRGKAERRAGGVRAAGVIPFGKERPRLQGAAFLQAIISSPPIWCFFHILPGVP